MRRGRNGPRQPGGGKHEARAKTVFAAPKANAVKLDLPSHAEQSGAARAESGGILIACPPPRAARRRPSPPAARGAGCQPGVQTVTVAADESNMRVDRFFEARFPGLSFSHIQRIIRKGEVRLNGKRTQPKARLEAGQKLRIPPLKLEAPKPRDDAPQAQKDRAFIKSITLYEDDDVLVLNKPMGLAVQGGSGTPHHLDGMLGALRGNHADAQRPRLVHRLDKDTAGCLLVAKTRFAAAALAKTFRSRSARKIYWALVVGVPSPAQGRISTYLAKQEIEEDSYMRIAAHGEKDAVHAVTYYAVVETAAQTARLAVAQAGDRAYSSVARAHGAYRASDRRRPEILQQGELAIARRHPEQAASSGAPHRRAASARRADRCVGAAAAAHAADLEPARLRHQPLRPHRRRAGGGVAAARRAAYLEFMACGFR